MPVLRKVIQNLGLGSVRDSAHQTPQVVFVGVEPALEQPARQVRSSACLTKYTERGITHNFIFSNDVHFGRGQFEPDEGYRKLSEVGKELSIVTLDGSLETIQIDDPCVSRNHALLFQQDHRWFICDLNSRNGTYVEGARITKVTELCDGDVILMGSLRLEFSLIS